MRSKTTSVTKKSRPQTPERASKYQLIGSSTPRPRITYGKHSRNRSLPDSPSRYHQSLAVVSTSTTSMQSLASDYEEPIVVPDSPQLMNTPSLSASKDTSFASAPGIEKIGLSTNVQIDRQNEIDESKIYPQSSSTRSTRASTREAKLKDALARTEENLKVALQDAQDAKNEIEALKKAEEVRNECPCCAQVMFQPFILSCGHTCCKECLVTLVGLYIKSHMNFACPSCRAVQGRFTPIPNYACQSHVDEMLKGKTPTNRQPLQWPRQFRSGPVVLPYPPSNGTFPVLHPRAPASPVFPIVID
ncbi:uncharacterized protein C8R40DRAFT_1173922 [Lentinula edodes]|uniref:uncharacterized protein n=1 Tax=Lentinula edodes TaxID=5353 RepID=UPI001E8EDC62|nr:uncharacterized protein C8R40DRAFT_1173922 [Lentinula edodes]KAH7872197.1 hypothetical protein C8R40DRAFT_1173922 [Lentinula edodes]